MLKRNLINVSITIFIGLIIYYFMLPPINLTAPIFYTYIIILLSIYFVVSCLTLTPVTLFTRNPNFNFNKFSLFTSF